MVSTGWKTMTSVMPAVPESAYTGQIEEHGRGIVEKSLPAPTKRAAVDSRCSSLAKPPTEVLRTGIEDDIIAISGKRCRLWENGGLASNEHKG
jgi:hypothetical protein